MVIAEAPYSSSQPVLSRSGAAHRKRRVDPAAEMVIRLIAKEKNLPIRLLVNLSRGRQTAARARQLAMYLVHVCLGRNLADVGAIFGRDRTTVSHACALVEDRRDDKAFDALVGRLELAIEASLGEMTTEADNDSR